jgi:hypothetical protein
VTVRVKLTQLWPLAGAAIREGKGWISGCNSQDNIIIDNNKDVVAEELGSGFGGLSRMTLRMGVSALLHAKMLRSIELL